MFTGGSVMERFRQLPGGRDKGGFVLRDATASDGETQFKVRGQVRFGGTEEAGTFTVHHHFVIIGPDGRFGTVRQTTTFSEGGVTVDATGTCSLRFNDHEDGHEHEH